MSRTFVHKPFQAKIRDTRWRRHLVEQHDHRHGVCDLANFRPDDWGRTNCHIDVAYQGRNIWCGCRMCTGHHGRKHARRQERVQLQSMRRTAVKTQPAHWDELDLLPVPSIW